MAAGSGAVEEAGGGGGAGDGQAEGATESQVDDSKQPSPAPPPRRDARLAFSSDLNEPPRALSFGNPRTSVFDARVTSAEKLPFQLPVSQYLEETLFGIRGAQSGDNHARDASSEDRRRWKRLQKTLTTDAAREICEVLFWVALGVLFDAVAEEAKEGLSQRLAERWFQLSNEVRRNNPDGTHAKARLQTWLLEMIPVALVQAVFRLLVDAFPPEHEKLVRSTDTFLDKLAQIAHREIFGFCVNRETTRDLRKRLFCQNLLFSPAANQKESMMNELRREKQSRRNRHGDPLSFGQEGLPMEEMQLEHVLEQRQKEKIRALRLMPSEGGSSPKRGSSSAENLHKALFSGFLPVGAEMLSVDRYFSLNVEGEELMQSQIAQLEDQTAPEGHGRRDSDGPWFFGGLDKADGSSGGSRPGSQTVSGTRSRSVLFFPDTVGQQPPAMRNARFAKRDAQVAERKRRDTILTERLARPLTQAASLSTVLVSPLVDKLAPSGGDRALLHKPHAEARRLRMTRPNFGGSLPSLVPSRAEQMLMDMQHPEREKSNSPRKVSKAPQQRDIRSAFRTTRSEADPMGTSGRFAGHKQPEKAESILMEPPARLKSEVVLSRLDKQAEAAVSQSFERYKKDYDLQTGQLKNSFDPRLLDHEERQYISRMQGLVGKPTAKAPRMLNKSAYDMKSGRSVIAKRKEQIMRESDEVSVAIFSSLSEVGSTSLLKAR